MRASDFIFESDSEYKLLLRLSGKWILDIEKDVNFIEQLYNSNPSMENYLLLKNIINEAKINIINEAKINIIKSVNSGVLANNADKVTNRIRNQYEEYYLKLIKKQI